MSYYTDELTRLAELHAAMAAKVIPPTAQSLEDADIARLLREAVEAMRGLSEDKQQDYAHRMKFALWQRMDDSPVTEMPEEVEP